MSAQTPFLGAARTNAGALVRHARIRLLAVARDPVALGLLVVAGLGALPFWHLMGFHDLSIDSRWRWHFWGPAVFGIFFWTPLVALPVSGALGRGRARLSTGPILPALPVGPRCRAAAEAMVGLLVVLTVHVPVSLLYQQWLYPQWQILWATSLRNTLAESGLGLLFALPFVLAWAAVPRFAWSQLWRPLAVCALVLVAAAEGLMLTTGRATLVSVALALAVLVTIGFEIAIDVAGLPRRRFAPLHSASPGPIAQFRRDLWQGVPRRLWPYLLVALLLPFLLSAAWDMPLRGSALFQLPLLAVVLLYPFGIKLVSAHAAGGVFSGYFASAWSILPVPRHTVLRGVYVHGLIVSALLWLVLSAYLARLPGAHVLLEFELPGIAMAPAVLLCEAAGDRRRGALALGALLAFQFGVPLASVLIELTTGRHLSPATGYPLAVCYLLALVGGLPPLVHLRSQRAAIAG